MIVESEFEKQQKKAVEHELERLKLEIGLENKHFETIKKQIRKQLIEEAASVEKAIGENELQRRQIEKTNYLSRELANAIYDSAEEFVDRQKIAEYRADYEEFLRWEDRMARKCIIVFLDTYLELTSDQVVKIEHRLTENWNYRWNAGAFTMSFNAYSACQPVLDFLESNEAHPNQITELLTPIQKEIFDDVKQIGAGYRRVIAHSVEADQKQLDKELQLFLDRSIESLQATSELNAKQLSRIKVGFKGAKMRIINTRKKDFAAYGIKRDLWHMSSLMNSPFQQMRTDEIWGQAIARTLTGSELEEFIRNSKQRQQRRLEVSPIFPIYYINKHWRLSYKETLAVYELATQKIVDDNESMIYRSVFSVFSMPENEVKKVLSEKTFGRIKDHWLGVPSWSQRKEFEAADEKRAASEEAVAN